MVKQRRNTSDRRRIVLVTAILVTVVMAVLFVNVQTSLAASSGKTRTITDMNGKKVEVPDPLTRVALFGGPTGQIAYVLGARDQLCAVTSSLKGSELVRALDPTIVNLPGPRSTSGQVNIEELLLSEPQLVIAGDLDGSIVEKKTKIPVAYTESTMAQGVLRQEIRFYAHIFQKEARGEKYIAYLDKMEAFLRSRTKSIPEEKRKKVFNGYGPAHLVTLGGDTFMHERILNARCVDATASVSTAGVKEGLHSGLSEMSMEQVLGWDPDIIVIDSGKPEDLYNEPKWKTVKAIRNRQVVKQPIGIFIWDRPTAEAAVLHPLWLAKVAYPELFKDIDLVTEVKRFYREIMAFNLTDDQAHDILNGAYSLRFGPVAGAK